MDFERMVSHITDLVMEHLERLEIDDKQVPVGISARHIHLSPSDLEALFGEGYQLQKRKLLSQPGQFAAEEVVELIGPSGKVLKARILGPVRPESQVEVSMSDARHLGVHASVRSSGDIKATPGIIVRGPKGEKKLLEGVIIADRHIHMDEEDAAWFEVENKQRVKVRVKGEKGGVMEQVEIRVHKNYALDFHIDTDDANAFLLQQGDWVSVEKE